MPVAKSAPSKTQIAVRLNPDVLAAVKESARDSGDTLTGRLEEILRVAMKREGRLPWKKTRGKRG
jgi:hypothetical protein